MSLKDLFDGLRRATKDARAQFDSLNASAEAKRRERDMLRNAPPARDDLKGMLRRWVDAAGRDFSAAMESQLRSYIVRPTEIPLDLPPRLEAVSPVGALMPLGGKLTAQDLDRVLAALFPDLVREALCRAVDGMNFAEGSAMAERNARIRKLDAEIADIERQQMNLIEEAQAAGVNIFAAKP